MLFCSEKFVSDDDIIARSSSWAHNYCILKSLCFILLYLLFKVNITSMAIGYSPPSIKTCYQNYTLVKVVSLPRLSLATEFDLDANT